MLVSCARCGLVVKKKPKEIKERNYCSRECWYKARAPRPGRRTGHIKTCEACNQTFYVQVSTSARRYCSMSCRRAGHGSRTITCKGCGRTVTGKFNPNRTYCSFDCFRISLRPQCKTGEMRPCKICDTEFYVPRARIKEALYCSKACANVWQGRNKTEHTCMICSKVFRWSPSRTRSGNYNVKYCSMPCRDADPGRRTQLLEMQAKQQVTSPTIPESIGYELLDRIGLNYQKQVPFKNKFIPDAILPEFKVIVQFDGDYWHDRAGTSVEPRILQRVRYDKSQDAYVRACGWSVLRLWESDLLSDPERCSRAIRKHLRLPPPARPTRTRAQSRSNQLGA